MRHTIVTALALVLPASARAGNGNSFFLGNGAAISGGAVTVVGDDGASLWYNPAGLVAIRRDTLDLSGSAYMLRVRDYPGILRGDLPDRPAPADPRLDLEATEILTVPSALAFVRNLAPDLSLGFGLFVPRLDGFEATRELAVDEPTLKLDAAVELSGSDTVYAGAVGVGYNATDRLRLGASLILYYQSVDLAQTLLFGYDTPNDPVPVQGNGTVVQEDAISRVGFNVVLGAQWQMTRCLGVGLVLRSPIVQVHESLERRRFQLGADVAPSGDPTLVTRFEPLRESAFDASIFLNFAGTLALAWTPAPETFLSLELDLMPGSNDDGVERAFVWNMRLGGVVPLSDTVRLGAGLFTDRSWEPEPSAAWQERVHYYGLSAGIYFETPLLLADRSRADSLVFTSTIGLRYALGVGSTLRAVADPAGIRTDPEDAEVDLVFHEISLHVGSGLRF